MNADHPATSAPTPAAPPPGPAAGSSLAAVASAPAAANPQTSGLPAEPATPGGVKPPAPCLYFLVSAAREGPLAGLFKLGSAECFAPRHRTLVRRWGTFDLGRSALLHVNSRKTASRLEGDLHHLFEDWRRDPGGEGDGHTEFYGLECLEAMLARAQALLACYGGPRAGALPPRGSARRTAVWTRRLTPYPVQSAGRKHAPAAGPSGSESGSGRKPSSARCSPWPWSTRSAWSGPASTSGARRGSWGGES